MKTITITLEFDSDNITEDDIYEYLKELMYDESLSYSEAFVGESNVQRKPII
jgi:hypothetical protein